MASKFQILAFKQFMGRQIQAYVQDTKVYQLGYDHFSYA
jgi:hypothetical protein